MSFHLKFWLGTLGTVLLAVEPVNSIDLDLLVYHIKNNKHVLFRFYLLPLIVSIYPYGTLDEDRFESALSSLNGLSVLLGCVAMILQKFVSCQH